jgi:hypothetical protein
MQTNSKCAGTQTVHRQNDKPMVPQVLMLLIDQRSLCVSSCAATTPAGSEPQPKWLLIIGIDKAHVLYTPQNPHVNKTNPPQYKLHAVTVRTGTAITTYRRCLLLKRHASGAKTGGLACVTSISSCAATTPAGSEPQPKWFTHHRQQQQQQQQRHTQYTKTSRTLSGHHHQSEFGHQNGLRVRIRVASSLHM